MVTFNVCYRCIGINQLLINLASESALIPRFFRIASKNFTWAVLFAVRRLRLVDGLFQTAPELCSHPCVQRHLRNYLQRRGQCIHSLVAHQQHRGESGTVSRLVFHRSFPGNIPAQL